jgi:hypothetical protein
MADKVALSPTPRPGKTGNEARIRVVQTRSAPLEAESCFIHSLEALGAGVEFIVSLLKAVVLSVQSHATYRLHAISAEIAFSTAGFVRHLLTHRVHWLSPDILGLIS